MKIIIHPVAKPASIKEEVVRHIAPGDDARATKLYNQRCIASNRLREDFGDPNIIAENLRLIDEIQRLEQERRIARGSTEKIARPSVEAYAVYAPGGNYTESQLRRMNYAELGELRDKLRFQRLKLKKAELNSTTEHVVNIQDKIQRKQMELDLVDNIRKEVKDGRA